MNVGELRDILQSEWIPDGLIIQDYNDNVIDDVNLVIEKDGTVSAIRFSMSAA